ncbi:helix-turn-helix domain-containing protein [Vulcanisaeta souniana]|uniref:DNA-directed RNA polymerase sigma-70 factor n=1 Tax=Vulcanisaeta souniana JCM 11219 TaxID=1293586 RepID=A0A830EHP4_9CREN|nr:helix-turn-helix domain-containing protein [Vulcanisaeta souniana]BDR92936.1 DNA-directed RNA polymerase sigma-70 factor [Vulcanisaeta souniana JCM 11219]GGI85711.1 DNA-directed RNA polymerase sigma-70 factor [Vulcanisaeta souniana JCM 11219]
MVLKVILEAHRGDCRVQNALKAFNLNFSIARVNVGDEVSTHLVKLDKPVDRDLLNYLRRSGLKVNVIDEETLWVSAPSCSACRALSRAGLLVEGGKPGNEDSIVYTVLSPGIKRLRTSIRQLRSSGVKVRVLDMEQLPMPSPTERQLEVLLLAYKMGYFDREVNLKELAKQLGLSISTVSELLRKTLKKVVMHYFEEIGITIDEDRPK